MSQFAIRSGRSAVTAALFGVILAIAPSAGFSAETAAKPTQAMSGHGTHADEHGENRIKKLHDKLHITAAQEELWGNVAQTMRDNDKTFKAAKADRTARGKDMTAVDDLKFMQIISDQHSAGLKQLIPQFETLYAAMTPEQQKQADHVFSKHQHGDDKSHYDHK